MPGQLILGDLLTGGVLARFARRGDHLTGISFRQIPILGIDQHAHTRIGVDQRIDSMTYLPRSSRTVGPSYREGSTGGEIESMSASRRRFSQEFKDELCREVISTSKLIKDVASAYGVGSETLRNWLIKYRDANGGSEAELTVTERARLKDLQRENQDLQAETAFLKKATLGSRGRCNI